MWFQMHSEYFNTSFCLWLYLKVGSFMSICIYKIFKNLSIDICNSRRQTRCQVFGITKLATIYRSMTILQHKQNIRINEIKEMPRLNHP